MLFILNDKDLDKARYSSAFGSRVHPVTGKVSGHRGIDIAIPQGTNLIAPLSGKVHMNRTNGGGVNSGYGHYLVLELDNGDFVLYGHLRERSKLGVGQRVSMGQVVAISGNTGTSTGAHVHYEYHIKGFLFGSQVTGKDTVIDPVVKYPQLNGHLGKNLGGLNFNPVPTPPKVEFTNFTSDEIKIKEKDKDIIYLRGVRKNFSNGSYNQFIALRELNALGYKVEYKSNKTTVERTNVYEKPVTSMEYIVDGTKEAKVDFVFEGKSITADGLENKDRFGNTTRFVPVSVLNSMGRKVSWNDKEKLVVIE